MIARPLSSLALPALAAAAVYLGLGWTGDLDDHGALLVAALAVLLGTMALGWRAVRRWPGLAPGVIVTALLFRLLAATGSPGLSDDVYRYVWDGRVQRHGFHPYRHAPDDLALAELRDASWERINHPELHTIYPPLAEMWFLLLASVGAGPSGFRLASGLLDFGVVLALGSLLRALGLPRDRLVFYAWNPLAVLESAGNGHVEPLGVLLVVLATAWAVRGRELRAAVALAGAIQAKLLPLLLVPGYLRRSGTRAFALTAAVTAALLLPYAATGPAFGSGLLAYASRWEFNASVFAVVRGTLDWLDSGTRCAPAVAGLADLLGTEAPERWYRLVWPEPLARGLCILALGVWIGVLLRRSTLGAPREAFLVFAGALVLSPTVHPWYVLWILPLAAAFASTPWLAFAALVPLSYLAGGRDVPWAVRAIVYAPLAAAALAWIGHRLGASMPAWPSWRRSSTERGPSGE